MIKKLKRLILCNWLDKHDMVGKHLVNRQCARCGAQSIWNHSCGGGSAGVP